MFVLSDLPRPIVRYAVGLWHRRAKILVIAWILAIIGWALTMLMPDYYGSRAEIYINTDQSLRPDDDITARQDYDERVRVMRLALLTRENLEEVVYDTGLDVDVFNEVQLERLVSNLKGDIEVDSPEDQYFVISYYHKDPVVAQKVVQSVIELFKEKDLGAALEDFDVTLEAFNTQIEKYESQLQAKEQEIAEFRRLHAGELANTDRMPLRIEAKQAQLDAALAAIASEERRLSSLRATLSATPKNTSGSELDLAKIRLAELQSQFNENYPDIQALKARITELESGSAALPTNPEFKRIEADISATRDEIIGLRERVDKAEEDITAIGRTMAQVPTVQAELTDITRDYEELQTQYASYRAGRRRVQSAAEVGNGAGGIRYITKESPKVAAEPTYPLRGLLTILILFGALGVATGIAFLLAQVDRSYTQSADLEDALGLPVLGAISEASTPKSRRKSFLKGFGLSAGFAAMIITAGVLYYMQEIYVSSDKVLESSLANGNIKGARLPGNSTEGGK